MMRRVAAVVAGMLVAFVVVFLVQAVSSVLYPMPPDVDMSDQQAMQEFVAGLPLGAFLFVIAAHILGAFAGAYVCVRVVGEPWMVGPLIIGALLMLAGIGNLVMIPHPIWFAVADMLTYLPSAVAGGKMAGRGLRFKAASQ